MDTSNLDTLQKARHSPEEDLNTWSKEYCDDHSQYYLEMLDLVDELTDAGDRILEVGSLPCHLTYLLSERGMDVVGVDLNPGRMSEFIEESDLEVRTADIESEPLPAEDNSVDFVLFTEVLEHLRMNPLSVFEEFERVLRPGGKVLITTPNQYSLTKIWEYVHFRGIQNHAIDEWSKIEDLGHMGHVRRYAPVEVRQLCEHANLEVLETDFSNFGAPAGRQKSGFGPVANVLYKAFPFLRVKQIHLAENR